MNLSNKFDKLSIRHKISLPVIASALVFFLFIFAFITIIERSAMFKKIEYDVGIMAEMAASNSVTALVFDDRKTGEEILSSFSKLPGVVSAVLYNQKGHVFAQYPKTGLDATGLAKVPFKEGFHYGKGRLTVSRNIYFNDRLIGNVFITTTLQDVDRILKDYIIYSAVILSSGFLGVLLISALLQRLLVRPIMHLRNTIDSVSTGNDYSIRSEKAADDEIGYLVDGFNNMLSQVQRRDAELNK